MRFGLRAVLSVSLAFALPLLAPPPVAHGQVGIRFAPVAEGAVRVDGALRDWGQVRFAHVGRGRDGSMGYAFGYDARGLYVAARVRDDRLVRSASPTRREDAVVVTLAVPRAGDSFRASELWLFAGIPGRLRSQVFIGALGARPRALGAAQIVEGPLRRGSGYVVEAFVPWQAIPGGSRWQQGRVAIRLHDVDSEAHPQARSVASAEVDPRHLERLPAVMASGGEAGMLNGFLASRELVGTQPRYDLRGDVAGDRRPERVVVVRHYVVVMGPGYRAGAAYDFLELPVASAGDVRRAELADVTGDGKRELLVTLRQANARGSRDVWTVFSFQGERVRQLFAVEVRKETSDGFVQARLRRRRAGRGAPRIVVTPGRTDGLSAQNFREVSATGTEAILLPWGPVLARTYRWDGQRFAVVSERQRPDAGVAAPARTATSSGRGHAQARPEPPPAPPTVRALIAGFRRRARVPRSVRPRFRGQADLAEDRRAEHFVLLGRALVVVGAGFRGGTGWVNFDVPAASDADVLGVFTGDVNGDGKAEVLIRIRRMTGDVAQELLLVHSFRGNGFPRIAAIEVARQREDHRVENYVRFIGRGRSRRLEVRPGRVRGWSEDAWPFSPSTDDSVDEILLPWRDRAVVYQLRGGRLRRGR